MDDKIDKNAIKNLPTEVARKEASTWIKKLISKSQHSPPALTKNGGFEQQSSTATANQPNQSAHVSRQRKSSEPHTLSPERQSVARRASRSVSPTSPGRAQGVCTNTNASTGTNTSTNTGTNTSNSGRGKHKK